MMNGYPKHVASTTLQEPLGWNNSTIIKGNIPEEVDKLKRQPGKDILVFGSAQLVRTLMEHDLIDEYRLMVFPIIVGKGKRLFEGGEDGRALKLVDSKTFGTGSSPSPTGPKGVRQDEQRRYKRLRRGQRHEDVLRAPWGRPSARAAPWRVRHHRELLRRAAAGARALRTARPS
jgi:dihydrofolate reductase